MPKNDIDYSKTIIYKIVCNDLNITECYVGKTTNFSKRKANHKACFNKGSLFKVYELIRNNGGWDNWSMVMIGEYNCKNNLEASKLEREWYEKLNTLLNTQYPSRTNKEYNVDNGEKMRIIKKQYRQGDKYKEQKKKYYDNHLDSLKDYKKAYYEVKKEEIAQLNAVICQCECGCSYTHSNKARHMKSAKHQAFINNLEK